MAVARAKVILVVGVLVGSVLSAPAGHANSGGAHTGTLRGIFAVAKHADCANDGTAGGMGGGGLGLPAAEAANQKNLLYWHLALGVVVDVGSGPGIADLCGRINKPALPQGAQQLGASCLSFKGWDGRGWLNFPDAPDLYVSNITWKLSVGTTFTWHAHIGTLKGKKRDLMIGKVVLVPHPDSPTSCADKGVAGPKSGVQLFDATIKYTITANAGEAFPKKDSAGKK